MYAFDIFALALDTAFRSRDACCGVRAYPDNVVMPPCVFFIEVAVIDFSSFRTLALFSPL